MTSSRLGSTDDASCSLFSFAVLASWFRLKYPHVAIGALASSAPILQFDHITPWSSFYDAVSQDFKVTKLWSTSVSSVAASKPHSF